MGGIFCLNPVGLGVSLAQNVDALISGLDGHGLHMIKHHNFGRVLTAWVAILWSAVVMGSYWVGSWGYYHEKITVFSRFLLGRV